MRRVTRPVPVTFLIDSLGDGGAERFALQLALALDRERYQPDFVLTRALTAERHLDVLRAADIPFLQVARTSRYDVTGWVAVLRHLRRRGTAVLHAHKHSSNVPAAVLGPIARVPVVIGTEHTWAFAGDRTRLLLDRHVVARGCARVVAVSGLDRDKLVDVVGMPRDRVDMIPTGYVPHGADDAVPTLRRELGIAPGTPVVGSACIFRAQKDLPTMLRAHRRVVDVFPDAILVLIGDGPEQGAVAALVAELGLDANVRLPGRRHDVSVAMRDLDVYVMSSTFEGAPLALIEAMMGRRAIVSTAVGGIPEMTEGGVVARLVAPGDPDALAREIIALLRAPEERLRLGDLAHLRAATHYRFDAVVERWSTLYESLLAERTPVIERAPVT
jgi:glycosyltransferase involved in cell wall biosynthesis